MARAPASPILKAERAFTPTSHSELGMETVFLNGSFVPKEEARISPDDRGFLFADGVYEVTPAYRGRFFRLGRHLARLRSGLKALQIGYAPSLEEVRAMHRRLLEENGLEDAEVSYVYLQVTRGAAPRTHAFPADEVAPTVYGFAREFVRPERERWEEGFTATTVPDRRWSRVDIKSIALLPNVLALQAAKDAGTDDAILVRDGVALEGAHNNLFAVFDGTVVTHPATHEILHGITRTFVMELCREAGLTVEERAIQVEELFRADEVFFTGTTTEVKPAVRIDGRPVGSGEVGPVSRKLYDAFLEGIQREVGGRVAVGEEGEG